MEISKKTMQAYLAMCLDDMSEIDKAAMGLLIKRLSGSSQSDEEYLLQNYPNVDPAEVLQSLREYEEYKLQQKE